MTKLFSVEEIVNLLSWKRDWRVSEIEHALDEEIAARLTREHEKLDEIRKDIGLCDDGNDWNAEHSFLL